MDQEKSSNSSFEDLSNLNDTTNLEKEISSSASIITNNNQTNDNSTINNEIMDLIGNGQITKKTIKNGDTNIRPINREFVKINYTGKLEDGTIVEEEQNFEIQVGDFEVVQGLDMAIPLMCLGEIANVHLDSRFAYGSLGLKNETNPEKSIPPDAKIDYTVEILDIQQEDEDKLNTFTERKRLGNRKRERANFWYNRNEFNIAIQLYRRALEYLDDTESGISGGKGSELTNSELQELLEYRLVVYNNLAMSQIKISAYDAALTSVENVLRCQPNNSKALFRKGRILDAKGNTKGAIALLQRAAILEPDSKSIQQDLGKLILKNRREERNEKEMYKKMLGQANKILKSQENIDKNSEVSKLKLMGCLIGSVLIGVAGVAMYRYKY